ncbi:MAG TPA: tetratricopeptide repeat protein [Opitutaceae bacterium]|nr:tetratricopeptide repeat protein [Opitutaceae bacterium]
MTSGSGDARRPARKAVAATAAVTPADRLPWWDGESRWMTVLVFAATLIAYWSTLHAGYIWDDAGHVTRTDLRPLSGLWRIWFEKGATQQYYPLLHSAFWFEYHIWGDAPLGYHLLNILLHATSACLFATALRRLAIPGAWLGAFLFALHPVAVESVAWVAEQKNTLSTVLYLCAALAYLRFDGDRQRSRYAVATVLFVMALATKTVSATLPAALLVVFWWKRGRLDWRRDIAPLAPWFVLSAAAGVVTSWVERTLIGASGSAFELDVAQRCLLAGRVFWFYLGKLLWPADLMFVYPRWNIDATAAWQYLFPLAAVALLAGCWMMRRRGVVAALLFFGGTLFPALGFINVFPFLFSYVADHFQYLADFGMYALAAAGAAALLGRISRGAGIGAVGIACVGLGLLTSQQTHRYHDDITLYETTLAENPSAWMAHTNLAIALMDAGRQAEAIPHYEAALKLHPNYPEGENNFGYALTMLGQPAAAIPHLKRALQLKPDYAEAHNNLGIALMNTGRPAEGQAEFESALRYNPAYPEAHLNLGLALARAGRTADAIAQFTEAVRLRPDYGDAELNWAIGLTLTDRFAEAQSHFERALAIEPNSPGVHSMYGRALARAGHDEQAVVQYRAAIELNPNDGDAHLRLALLLRRLGRSDEAAREYQFAQQLGAAQ